MTTETSLILERLDEIKSELDYIKDHMAHVDTVLTEDDGLALKEVKQEYKLRKTKRL